MWIADLHIHSRFSRATSRDCDAPHLDLWGRYKGIDLIGTGDFTHPQWRKELREMLSEDGNGFYSLKEEYRLPCGIPHTKTPRFVVTGEISTIYKRDGKTRKVHHVILLPSLDAADDLARRLEAIGNLHSDGRPILGLDSRDLLSIVIESCPEAVYIPAHIWTPHFSLFGAFSGFDSIEECYGDLTPYIHALETGLSSDPPMNRLLSSLDGHLLVSNSDAHSPSKLGREANLLSCGFDYPSLKQALNTGEGFGGTIEFFPEEGKYHLDGHRACHCRLLPEETVRLNGSCPVCGRKITIGVLNRVEALADRKSPGPLDKPYESLIPLPELMGEILGVSADSKKAQSAYFALLQKYGPEFSILREYAPETLEQDGEYLLGQAIRRLRAGNVTRIGGYDGEYGQIQVFQPGERETLMGQTSYFSFTPIMEKKKRSAVQKEKIAEGTAQESVYQPNVQQETAITAEDETIAVIAGPGTGKTGTLIGRIAYLIEEKGVSPKEITAVTFTRQAAQEMKERLEKRLGRKAAQGITVGTFHSICLSMIPTKPLVQPKQAREIMAELIKDRKLSMSPASALQMVSAHKNGMRVMEIPEGLVDQYNNALQNSNLRDLDDILLEALKIPCAKVRAFHHILVDEYQDLNPVQRQLALRWSEGNHLFVIGDADQSIYSFRGADAGCFDALKEARENTRLIRLEQNYRSTKSILDCAISVIEKNPGEKRRLIPLEGQGAPVRLVTAADESAQNIWIAKEISRLTGGIDMLEAGEGERAKYAFSDIAVLCRTHRQLEGVEKCLNHDSIPCVVSTAKEELQSEMCQGLLGFFSSLLNPLDMEGLRNALRGIWHYGDALVIQAEQAMALGPDSQAFHDFLAPYEALGDWGQAVHRFLPLVKTEKPRVLMERLALENGINPNKIEKLLNTAVFFDDMASFLTALQMGEDGDIQRLSGGKQSGAVRLMTLHAAKGLEFPVVFIAGIDEGTLPMVRPEEITNTEEERRLFYVGVTRAKKELILLSGGKPSPFLAELSGDIRREDARGSFRRAGFRQMSMFD